MNKIRSTLLGCLLACVVMTAQADKPNVILIMTDDQGYGDLSCHGNPVLKTPNLDKLHAEGIRMTDFHVSPVCAPTRAALMTGRDALKAGGWTTTTDRSMLFAGLPTLAETFAAGGYRTAMYGKWHLGAVPPYRPSDRGFHESLYEPGGMIGMTPEHWCNDVIDTVFEYNNAAKKSTGYRTDVLFDESMKWMAKQQEAEQPFFVYLATLAPHGPHWVPEKYSAPYRQYDKETKLRKPVADFFGMIANIDENVGKLDAFLKERGLRENTIVIFMTDNGGTRGTDVFNVGMKGQKGDVEEGGHRVPFFIRWPNGGLGGGRDINELTAHVDVLPTLADLCGIGDRVPDGIDGMSFAPLLRGETDRLPERHLFVRHDNEIKKNPDYNPKNFAAKSGVLSGKWRLIGGKELYNVETDPGQQKDVEAEHPEVVQSLRAAQEAYWNEVYPETYERPRAIRIGGEEVMFTSLYARPVTKGSIAFQREVCRGAKALADWMINIPSAGTYTFEVRRWPREVGAAMTASIPPQKKDFVSFPKGKPLPVKAVRLKVGDRTWTQPVPADANHVLFSVELDAGENVPMTVRLLNQNGAEIADGYYNYVIKAP